LEECTLSRICLIAWMLVGALGVSLVACGSGSSGGESADASMIDSPAAMEGGSTQEGSADADAAGKADGADAADGGHAGPPQEAGPDAAPEAGPDGCTPCVLDMTNLDECCLQ
jgi:hypothetical protein